MGKKLLSVSEFAKLTGISRQSVYKKIKDPDNQLSTCVNQVDNQIFIDIEAFKRISDNQNDNQTDNQTDNKVDSKNELIEILKKELEEKNKQLLEKDKQIETLQRLLDQEQQLHLIDKNNKLEISDTDTISVDSDQNETVGFWNKILNIFK
jgi:predicted DNA-binding protein YlxM (UPF0122 family)